MWEDCGGQRVRHATICGHGVSLINDTDSWSCCTRVGHDDAQMQDNGAMEKHHTATTQCTSIQRASAATHTTCSWAAYAVVVQHELQQPKSIKEIQPKSMAGKQPKSTNGESIQIKFNKRKDSVQQLDAVQSHEQCSRSTNTRCCFQPS